MSYLFKSRHEIFMDYLKNHTSKETISGDYYPETLDEYFGHLSKISHYYSNNDFATKQIISAYKNTSDLETKFNYIKTCSFNFGLDNLKGRKASCVLEKVKKCYYKNFRIIGLTDPLNQIRSIELLIGGSGINRFYPDQKDIILKTIPFTKDLEFIPQTISYYNNEVTYINSEEKMNGYQIPLFVSIGEQTVHEYDHHEHRICFVFNNVDTNELTFEYDLYTEGEGKGKQESIIVYQTQFMGEEAIQNNSDNHKHIFRLGFNHPVQSYGIHIFDNCDYPKNMLNLKDTIKELILSFEHYHIYVSSELLNEIANKYGENIIPLMENFGYSQAIYNSINLSRINTAMVSFVFKDNIVINNNSIVNIHAVNTNLYKKAGAMKNTNYLSDWEGHYLLAFTN